MIHQITVTKATIDSCFENAKTQEEIIYNLYSLIVPWDKVIKMLNFPKCGKEVSEYIYRKFIRFDYDYKDQHNVTYLSGGAWMNSGFSCDETMDPWNIVVDTNWYISVDTPIYTCGNVINDENGKKFILYKRDGKYQVFMDKSIFNLVKHQCHLYLVDIQNRKLFLEQMGDLETYELDIPKCVVMDDYNYNTIYSILMKRMID
jgi:hypothetical protein